MGLRSEASRWMTLWFVGLVCMVVVSVAYASISLWHAVNETMFSALNTCVDRGAGSLWQEQPYRPSPEYASCVDSVHHAAMIEASLAIGLLACAVAAIIVWMTEQFFDDYVVPADGSQAFTFSFRRARTVIGVAAILFAAVAMMIVFPVS